MKRRSLASLQQRPLIGVTTSEVRPKERVEPVPEGDPTGKEMALGITYLKAIEAAFPDAQTDWLDGVTVQYEEWWCNVRPSNTEPLLRLNLEAVDQATFEAAKAKVFPILGDPV